MLLRSVDRCDAKRTEQMIKRKSWFKVRLPGLNRNIECVLFFLWIFLCVLFIRNKWSMIRNKTFGRKCNRNTKREREKKTKTKHPQVVMLSCNLTEIRFMVWFIESFSFAHTHTNTNPINHKKMHSESVANQIKKHKIQMCILNVHLLRCHWSRSWCLLFCFRFSPLDVPSPSLRAIVSARLSVWLAIVVFLFITVIDLFVFLF